MCRKSAPIADAASANGSVTQDQAIGCGLKPTPRLWRVSPGPHLSREQGWSWRRGLVQLPFRITRMRQVQGRLWLLRRLAEEVTEKQDKEPTFGQPNPTDYRLRTTHLLVRCLGNRLPWLT